MHAETAAWCDSEETTVCRIFSWQSSFFEKIVWDDPPSRLRRDGAASPIDGPAAPKLAAQAEVGPQAAQDPGKAYPGTRMPVVIGSGSHPFPFRTRKLSLIPPMVLHGKLCGRVGRCRQYLNGPIAKAVGPFPFSFAHWACRMSSPTVISRSCSRLTYEDPTRGVTR